MFSHDDIWYAIDQLANKSGYSTSGLAKKAGLDPTAFNRSKRMSPEGKPRWPSTESVAKILAVTNVTMGEFMTFIHIEGMTTKSVKSSTTTSIPVIGCAQAGAEGYFTDAGYPQGEGWDYVDLPGFTPSDDSTYALEVSGDSMEPLYRDGDIIVVSPASGIRRGDRVVVKTSDGQVTVKELSRKTTSKIELKALNPNHENMNLSPAQMEWIARVLWVSQ
jgi:phage repressor protein C with HTH and peptisase S24 domain